MPSYTKPKLLNSIGNELYSAEIYPEGFFKTFNPLTSFEKWAEVELDNIDIIPEGMEMLNSFLNITRL